MEPIKQWLLLGLLLIASNITLHAAYAQKIDTYMQDNATFSGAILVAQDNTILFKKGYGYANYEFAVSNDENTRFPIASNTKSFTAVAIMMLHEKNVLNVHKPLCTYIPGFPDTITIHHLLTHTSGIPNYYQHWTSISNCTQLEEIANMIKTWDLEFKPGSRFTYSNTGYLLLAYIIEKLSGLPFESFLAEHIFEPLQMHDTGSIRNNHVITKKASGYHMQESERHTA
jgi:CubicO group peptidase (beta-lactamase class C family)